MLWEFEGPTSPNATGGSRLDKYSHADDFLGVTSSDNMYITNATILCFLGTCKETDHTMSVSMLKDPQFYGAKLGSMLQVFVL